MVSISAIRSRLVGSLRLPLSLFGTVARNERGATTRQILPGRYRVRPSPAVKLFGLFDTFERVANLF